MNAQAPAARQQAASAAVAIAVTAVTGARHVSSLFTVMVTALLRHIPTGQLGPASPVLCRVVSQTPRGARAGSARRLTTEAMVRL